MNPAVIDDIEACMESGFYAVQSLAGLSAGGEPLPDNRREYWIVAGPRRVARVSTSRTPAGRWRVDCVALYRFEPCGARATPEQCAALAGTIADRLTD